ncbi:MAG: S-adenosyl-l-methionine hydroxide adenosyltransferase family protein [Candidatus Bathyarchaeia archaeon]
MASSNPIVTLLTDFSPRDSYVAEMKGVLLSICPRATIIDISHDVQKFSVGEAAYLLNRAAMYFPPSTVHVAVVDPEVGGRRKSIVIETRTATFVGPDNGILSLATEEKGVRGVYEIKSKKYVAPHVSSTFHGRDIFARVAGHLANGVHPRLVGPALKSYWRLPQLKPSPSGDGFIKATILYTDSFGNVVTNISDRYLTDSNTPTENQVTLRLASRRELKMPFRRTYADIPTGGFVALIGSGGFIEISQNRGNAASTLGIVVGSHVELSFNG